MSKEVNNKICTFCESQYKISYDLEEVSGMPKFCSFCGESWEEDDSPYEEDDEE